MKQTKRILLATAALAVVAAVPASAHGPGDHPEQAKGPKAEKTHGKGQSKRCTPRNKAYVAKGVVESAALTKNADGTYDGTITVTVGKTNRHGRPHQGTSQTYTLDDAKVRLPDADGNGTVDGADAQAGQRAMVIGKITVLNKKCDASQFTATVTVRKITLRAPAAPKAPEQTPEQPQEPAPQS